jgi:hypothetical protein
MKNAKKKIERKNRLIEGAQLQKISSYTLIFFRKNHKKLAKIKKFKKIQKKPKKFKKIKKNSQKIRKNPKISV